MKTELEKETDAAVEELRRRCRLTWSRMPKVCSRRATAMPPVARALLLADTLAEMGLEDEARFRAFYWELDNVPEDECERAGFQLAERHVPGMD